MRVRIAIGLTGALLLLTGCSGSIEASAETCGGIASGIRADETAVVYTPADDPSGDGLTCLTRELFPDEAEQYAVVIAYDGVHGTLDLTDFTVTYGSLDGQDFISFSPRE